MNQRRRKQAMDLVWTALAAVDPKVLLAPLLRYGSGIELPNGRLFVIGAGKAGAGMAAAVVARLGDRIAGGWVNVPYGTGPLQPLGAIHIHSASHPLPDESGLEGTNGILTLLDGLTDGDRVLVLLSGGASALLVQPVPGVSLSDLRHLTDELLRCGAAIQELNAVRKHLSQVKGGRLAQRITRRGAMATVWVLSDVVGSPLDVIGSGPCTPDPTTFADAWAVLERYRLLEGVPRSVRDHLARGVRGEVGETPKPGDPIFERVQHTIVGDNRTAARALVARARSLGFHALLLTTTMEGEARRVGRMLAALAKEAFRYEQPLPRPACLVLGGETTVTVRGDGRGGRNQEVALAAALDLDGWADCMVVTLATDGVDGPTDAAGAVVTGQTMARARDLGLDAADHLARNDAYPFFAALGDLIRTGPTGTNVNDLAVVLVF